MVRVTKFSFILLLIFQSQLTQGLETFTRVPMSLNGKVYELEIADTNDRKNQGLMYRKSLDRDAGMLFYYQQPAGLYIWMKNTLIPLTVLWLNEHAEIIHMERLQPCRSDPCPSYGPDKPARYVLELHSAEWQRFVPGDQLPAVLKWQKRWYGK